MIAADDAEFVARVRAGDMVAYSRLVERYREAIYGLAYSQLRHYDDAQDVAQQAFLHAYQRLDQLRDPARFGPWLRTIALSLCRMRQRRGRELPIPERTAAEGGELERVEARIALEQMLACLSETTRLTLTLHYLRRYSLQEIAAFLEVPVTTVKSRLRNARVRLRKEIGETKLCETKEMWEMLKETVTPEPLPEGFARQVMQLLGGSAIYAVAFSPDGRLLAGGLSDGTIRLWDAHSGAPMRTLTGHHRVVTEIAFAPDSATLVSVSGDRTLRLWDAATGELRYSMTDHGRPNSPAFTPDGSLLAHTSVLLGEGFQVVTGRAVLRDAGTGILVCELEVMPWHTPPETGPEAQRSPRGTVCCVALSPDGATAATGNSLVGADDELVAGEVKLWDLQTRQRLLVLSAPGFIVKSVAFSPDGVIVAAACSQLSGNPRDSDGDYRAIATRVQLWRVETGEPVGVLAEQACAVAQQVAFSPNGRLLAARIQRDGADETQLYDVQTGQRLQTFAPEGTAYSSIAFAPDGQTLASAGSGDNVTLWRIDPPAP